MTKSRDLKIAVGVAAGLWALAFVGLSMAHAAPAASLLTHDTAVVTAIDRPTRSATLQTTDGVTKTVHVPDDVKAYDALKVGDRIDIDYFESIAVELLPPGAKPSMSESASTQKMGEGMGTMGTRQTTVSAAIVSIDTKANKVTLKGPQGDKQTVSVSDPSIQKRLPSLKPGDIVKVTYTEAVAATIRPR